MSSFFQGIGSDIVDQYLKNFVEKTFWILSYSATLKRIFNPDPLSAFSRYLEWIWYHLSDAIIIFSKDLIKVCDLIKSEEKIVVAPNHFIDFHQFSFRKPVIETKKLNRHIDPIVWIFCNKLLSL